MTPYKILFVVHNAVSIEELLPFAVALSKTGRYRPAFFLNKTFENYDRALSLLEASGVEVAFQSTRNGPLSVRAERPAEHVSRFSSPIWRPLKHLALFRQYILRYRADRTKADEILEQFDGAIVLAAAPAWGIETYLERNSMECGRPVMVLPIYDYWEGDDDLATQVNLGFASGKDRLVNASWLNRLTARVIPDQVLGTEATRFLPAAAAQIWAARLAGAILPPLWWIENLTVAAGNQIYSDTVALVTNGKTTVAVTGKPYHDEIHARLTGASTGRAATLLALGLNESRKLVLVALPQWAEEGVLNWPQHIALLRDIFIRLSSTDAQLLVSLHPRSTPSDYEFLTTEFGVVVSSERAHNLIPLCDCYVCGASTTANYAWMSGKPTIVLGLATDYPFFRNFRGFRYVDQLDQIGPELANSLSEPATVPIVDGQANQRLLALLDKIIRMSEGRTRAD